MLLRFRRLLPRPCVKRDEQRSDVDRVAVGELDRRSDALAAAEGAVLTAAVFKRGPFRRHNQAGVTPRNGGRIECDIEVGVAADDVLTDEQWKSLFAPLEPAHRPSVGGLGRLRRRRGGSAEGIPEAVSGSDELRGTSAIV